MNISKFCFPILLILLFLLTSPASLLAGGYNLAGVGAKALAMSGAYRAIADDWSAMYWNPAGIAGQSNVIALGGKAINPIVWLTPNITTPYPGYEGYRNGVEQTNDAKSHLAGSLGFIYGISEDMTAGFSVFAPSAIGAEWTKLYTGPPYAYKNTVPYPAKGWSSDLKVIDFHPTIAYQASEKLKVGLGIAIQYGDVTLQTPKVVPTGTAYPWQHFYVDAILEGTGLGYGFNAGLLCTFNERFNIGLAYRSEVTIKIDGTVKQTVILPYNEEAQIAQPALAHLFGGGTLTAEPDGSADFIIPMDFGFGVSYLISPTVTLAADMVWTNWGAVDEINIDLEGAGINTANPDSTTPAPEAEDSKMVMKYEDTFRISLGADILVSEANDTHIRIGYYYDPTPIPDACLRPSITDVQDKHNISLGFSYWLMDNLSLEGYYERIFTGTRTVAMEDADGDGSIDNVAGDWKLQVDTFGLTIGYRF